MIHNKRDQTQSGMFLPALLCTALWGSAIPAVKYGYALFSIADTDAMAKLYFAGLRFTIAGVLVLLFMKVSHAAPLLPERKMWSGIIVLSLMQTVMQYYFFYLGVGNTTGVRGSVLSATSTFFSVLAAHFAFADDRLNLRKSFGCALGFAGVVTLLSGAGLGANGIRITGEGFMIISAVGQGMGAVISRKISPGKSAMQITGWQLTLGGAVLFVIGAAGRGYTGMTNSVQGIVLLAYLALLSAIAFSVWTNLLGRYAVGRVTVFMFLIPVFGSLLSAVILHETVFTLRNFMALLLVSAGIAAVNYAKR